MDSNVRRQRDNELTDLFLSVLGDGMLAKEAMAKAASMPCSRFWIEPEHAMHLIWSRRTGRWKKTDKKNRFSVRNSNSIRRIDLIMERCGGIYTYEKICDVVYSPAPEFFISPRTAMEIITRTLQRRRKENRRC